MFRRPLRPFAAAAFLVIAAYAQAQDALPPPVNGITFDEWAAGNARLANQQNLIDILNVLDADVIGCPDSTGTCCIVFLLQKNRRNLVPHMVPETPADAGERIAL
jgi:hypothetical protein